MTDCLDEIRELILPGYLAITRVNGQLQFAIVTIYLSRYFDRTFVDDVELSHNAVSMRGEQFARPGSPWASKSPEILEGIVGIECCAESVKSNKAQASHEVTGCNRLLNCIRISQYLIEGILASLIQCRRTA
jgi:hypothetical protein